MGRKKSKDHYVAETYLKHFLNGANKVWAYDKEKLDVRERGRGEICWEPNGSNNPYFSESRVVENYLKIFEPHWNKAVGLFSTDEPISVEEYSEAKFFIAGYAAYLRFSTLAAIRAGQTSLEAVVKTELKLLKNQGAFPAPPKGFEFLLDDIERNFRVDVDQKYPQALGIQALVSTCHEFFKAPWYRVINKTDTPFITSDNPACTWAKVPSGYVYLPLSPNVAVLLKPNFDGSTGALKFDPEMEGNGEAEPEFVSEMNQLVARCAEKYVISNVHQEGFLDLVRDNRGWRFECITERVPVGTGYLLKNQWQALQKPC